MLDRLRLEQDALRIRTRQQILELVGRQTKMAVSDALQFVS
jgi:hypothetical protein